MSLSTNKSKTNNTTKKNTQADLVLAVLRLRGPTTTDIFEYMEVKSPSSVIHRLRKAGYRITTKLVWKKTFKYPWVMHQAEYTLNTSTVKTNKRPLFQGFAKGGMK